MLLTLLTAYSYLTPAGLRRRLPRDLRGGVLFRHALPQLHRRSGAHWHLQCQLPAHLRHVGRRRHATHGACHARHLPSRGAPPQGLAAPQLGDSAVAIAPRLATLASCGWLSRLLAARRTREEPLRRSGPNQRLCRAAVRPGRKSPILRRPAPRHRVPAWWNPRMQPQRRRAFEPLRDGSGGATLLRDERRVVAARRLLMG